jgi:Zn-dependent peptidase ImmA (M78 family)/transcriptional regulator with XRE-family HTH domain
MLTLAREAAGMTQVALAHAVGVSQARVSQMEHGLDAPPPGLAELLARELEVPPEFFDQPDVPVAAGLVDFFHRRRNTLPKKPLKRAHATANVIRLELLRLLQDIEMEGVQPWPVFNSEDYDPATAAQMLRASWRLHPGPAPSLVGLVEAAGVPVISCDLGHEKLSAISMPGMEDRHIILLNSQMPPSHLRFAMAHEIGHLVMHVGTASPAMEVEADQFASEFLMPESDIRSQLARIRFGDLGSLKHRWHVSMAALIRRARDVGAISENQYKYMNMQLNQLPNGRKREPGEPSPEQPALVRHLIEFFVERLNYSFSELARVMVTLEVTLRSRYLGETATKLRALGSPDRHLHRFPMAPPSA